MITPIPAFHDNYIWLLQDGQNACVVDPGQSEPVLAYIQAHGLQLQHIWITHHHGDHTGGIKTLKALTRATVYGPATVAGVDHVVTEGLSFSLFGAPVQVLEVPGHTLDHVAYIWWHHLQAPALFCGDTLFSAGAGRVFEGTPTQLFQSIEKLAQLPDNTQVYCAHEYTLANLAWAQRVEPQNPQLQQRLYEVQQARAQGQPSLPSTLGLEKGHNPFLRAHCLAVQQAVAQYLQTPINDAVQCFAGLRHWKNQG